MSTLQPVTKWFTLLTIASLVGCDQRSSDPLVKAWPIVIETTTKKTIAHAESPSPVTLEIQFSKSPYDWSSAKATRTVLTRADLSQIDTDLLFFVNAIKCEPFKDLDLLKGLAEKKSDRGERVEWEFSDPIDSPMQIREIRFRLIQR